MRFSWLIFLCLFCPFITRAQYGSITGKVVRAGSTTAVARASVFLSNSSFGTTSSDNGNFSLGGLRQGQYTLVVTAVGFDDYTKVVLVGKEPITLNIELNTKSIQLRDVYISTKADWRRNLEQFKSEFIGSDVNAKQCEVINPEILSFNFSKRKQTLEAFADNFLIVENRALGYRVKYLIKDYKSDRISGLISYSGQQLFEELPGKAAEKKKWQAKRDEAYYGSSMHFYRSLYKDRLNEEGFEVYRLNRLPNANRPPEALIYKNIERFKSSNNYAYRDSLRYWVNLESLSRYYMDELSSVKYLSSEICKTTDQPGVYALTFPSNLYIIYTKKREETYFRDIFRPLTMPNYETSVLSFLTDQHYSFFDMNGVIMNKGPLYEGTWSKSRLSMLLPVDYVPVAEQEAGKPVLLPLQN